MAVLASRFWINAICVEFLLLSPVKAEKLKGYVITTYGAGIYSSPASDNSVSNMSATGIDTVEVVVTQYMDTIYSTQIAPCE